MPVDENYWPGPTWDFTVWQGAFPTTNSPGDLYINFSGLRYLNTGKDFVRLTTEEWDALREDWFPEDSSPKRMALVTVNGKSYPVEEGDSFAVKNTFYKVFYDPASKSMWGIDPNNINGRRILLQMWRKS